MKELEQYTTEKRMHIDRIKHLEAMGAKDAAKVAMQEYAAFLADWTRKGIHKEGVTV